MDYLVHFDQQLLLALNGSESTYLDNIFMMVTKTGTWLPLAAVLLFVLVKNRPWREVLLFAVCLGLVILIADRVSSGLCKPFFHRFRPSHEPALEGLVDLVNGRRGGLYGFISSHAANTFGVSTFVALYLRRFVFAPLHLRPCTVRRMWLPSAVTLFLWACLSSYSRIYLGLHYPGDILCGALFGVFTGWLVFRLMRRVEPRLLPSRDALLLPAAFLVTLAVVALLALL